ncbi:DNA-binding protein [Motiliproteus sediminis]|uniref:DNA-binding protein n=1 Tax=Motiliproteus sediminis TaxID=1468178 RepID=UPI001AEFFC35|nr:DNA-binding protein [Motiliproteus sediminis]
MASDTYVRAQQIADELLSKGVKPTQQLIRDALGKGSVSTIHRALSDWWSSLGNRINKAEQIPDIPDNVSVTMLSLWEQAVAEAQRRNDEALLAARERAKQARAAMEQGQRRADAEKSELLQRLDEASRVVSEMQARVAELMKESADLERRLLDAERESQSTDRELRTLAATVESLEQRLRGEHELQQENANLRRALERMDRQR